VENREEIGTAELLKKSPVYQYLRLRKKSEAGAVNGQSIPSTNFILSVVEWTQDRCKTIGATGL
jgi:hypothetical protein